MKKILNTLPSTRPDRAYSSQASHSVFFPLAQPLQKQLHTLLKSLKQARKSRDYLLRRDIEEVFRVNEQLIGEYLNATSPQELWSQLNPKDDQLNEEQQIDFFIKLLLELSQRKHQQADWGNIKAFDEYRAAIEWLIPQIVQYEEQLRQMMEENLLLQCENKRSKREESFREYETQVQEDFERIESIKRENLLDTLREEEATASTGFTDKLRREEYKLRPSKQLSEAKNTALLKKLAPFRWQKKRCYEETTYRKQLERTIDEDSLRKMQLIDRMKKVEKERVSRAHQTLVATHDMHSSTLRDQMLTQLYNQRQELWNREEKERRNLKHSIDMSNKKRVTSLRKSLEAFTQHGDTLKIKQIMKDHLHKVQFTNSIHEATAVQADVRDIPARYTSFRAQNEDIDKKVKRHQRRLKNKIVGILDDDSRGKSLGNFSGRKSLLDLYDDSMNPVQ